MYPEASGAIMAARKAEYANQSVGAGQAVKQTPMQTHAQRLHELAANFEDSNGRLANLLARLGGPTPETGEKNPSAPPRPDGVLYVAELGAEKVGLEADKLRQLISRLENFI